MSESDDLSPDEEQVRRLLAEARHTEPLPADIAARLDAVLADLRREDPAEPVPVVVPASPPVTDLAAARRRRNVRSWLVAAAAVVVIGVGIDQVAQGGLGGGGGDADSSSAGDSSLAEDRPEAAQEDGAGSSSSGAEKPASGSASAPEVDAARVRPVRLDSARFGEQVRRLATSSQLERHKNAEAGSLLSGAWDADLDAAYAATCPATGWGRGVLVPVRYDGDAGALLFRPVRGETRVVDLFLCGSEDPARSITLPAP